MEKNQKEMQMLFEWGMENSQGYHFQEMDDMKKSYFEQRQDTSYIREYAFETLPEFMEELNALWPDNEIMEPIKKVIGVAAMKNKPVKVSEDKMKNESKKDIEDKLPAFIYNF